MMEMGREGMGWRREERVRGEPRARRPDQRGMQRKPIPRSHAFAGRGVYSVGGRHSVIPSSPFTNTNAIISSTEGTAMCWQRTEQRCTL